MSILSSGREMIWRLNGRRPPNGAPPGRSDSLGYQLSHSRTDSGNAGSDFSRFATGGLKLA